MATKNDLQLVATPMLTGATATGAGAWVRNSGLGNSTFQAIVTGTGSVSATVVVEVSNDGTNAAGTGLGTITLSGTTTASDGFANAAPWVYIRGNVTAISGTGAAVSLTQGS